MNNKIIRVSMTKLKITEEEIPEKYTLLGGRALTSKIINDEVSPTCSPLCRNNKIVIAPGLLAGTKAPCSGILSIGGKSPLTKAIQKSNSRRACSQKIAKLGIKAIIIEGIPEDDKFYKLIIKKETIVLKEAIEYEGIGTYKLIDLIRSEYGNEIGLITIGPAAEMKMFATGISINNMDNQPIKYPATGRLGAVLGSKGIKAIIIDDKNADNIEIKNKNLFNNASKKLVKAIREHSITAGMMANEGTTTTFLPVNQVRGLSTQNFKKNSFEIAERAKMTEIIKERGSEDKAFHSCYPRCIIKNSNIFADVNRETLCVPVEYETNGSFCSNLKIDDFDVIAKMNRICNDIGLDTIEAGATIGILMEAGVIAFGDGEAAINLLKEVKKDTKIGRIIGSGTVIAAKTYGINKVPTLKYQSIKGRSMTGYDLRSIKGIGLTYANGNIGADYTSSFNIASEIFKLGHGIDSLETKDKSKFSEAFQAVKAFIDSTGLCSFVTYVTFDIPEAYQAIIDMINAKYNYDYFEKDTYDYGRNIIRNEKEFNEKSDNDEVFNIKGDVLDSLILNQNKII